MERRNFLMLGMHFEEKLLFKFEDGKFDEYDIKVI